MAKSARRTLALVVAAGCGCIAALAWLWSNRIFAPSPPPAPPLALIRLDVARLPGWRSSDPRTGLAAFHRSCAALLHEPPRTPMGGAGYAGFVADWQTACTAVPAVDVTADAARRYFEGRFAAFEIVSRGSSEALFTGYYEPLLHASGVRHGPYTEPVYGLPGDLISVDLGQFRNTLKGEHVVGRITGHALVPYYTREEIDSGVLHSAPVLAYAEDPIAVFFLHVQGSGRAVLDDGQVVRLAYAGQNGRPYTPIGRTLIRIGAVPVDRMSMQTIRRWLIDHPGKARAIMESDQSFVFFQEAALGNPGLGSPGSEGIPLAPEASIAVDAHLHPLGIPFFIAAHAPSPDPSRPDDPVNRIFVAQDTGGAIRGATRADVFWGFGPAAESIAGRMKSKGRLYVLLPDGLASRVAHTKFTGP